MDSEDEQAIAAARADLAKLVERPSAPRSARAGICASARSSSTGSLSARRVSFDPGQTPPATPQRSSRGVRYPRPLSARSSVPTRQQLLPASMSHLDDYTAAGVIELVKMGFPPEAAHAAFLKSSSRGTAPGLRTPTRPGSSTPSIGARPSLEAPFPLLRLQ